MESTRSSSAIDVTDRSRLYEDGSLSAVSSGEEVVPASELNDALKQIRELQRLLRKETMENEIFREAVEPAKSRKWIARSDVATIWRGPADWRGRTARSPSDAGLVEEIRLAVADLPSYGYRRVWGLLRRQRKNHGAAPVNAKGVYRVMRDHGLPIERRTAPPRPQRRHDGTRSLCPFQQWRRLSL
ncbi:hypothetical protein CA602_11150 [Paraburkholderia hospita]|nr:hypothetical protein CA602_11150 [Paraburkholderia hospita]